MKSKVVPQNNIFPKGYNSIKATEINQPIVPKERPIETKVDTLKIKPTKKL